MAIAQRTGFKINTTRTDPYKNFRFRVFFQSKPNDPIIGISKVTGLKRTTEVVSHRDGGDLSTPRHAPGRTTFEAITLERGVTFDTEFEAWANNVYSTDGPEAVSLANYKRHLIIRVYNLQDVPVKSYTVFNCWVSSYTALPDLDANANATMIESIVLQNEGWERDDALTEQAEQ
jgi:phage tail-like protein